MEEQLEFYVDLSEATADNIEEIKEKYKMEKIEDCPKLVKIGEVCKRIARNVCKIGSAVIVGLFIIGMFGCKSIPKKGDINWEFAKIEK